MSQRERSFFGLERQMIQNKRVRLQLTQSNFNAFIGAYKGEYIIKFELRNVQALEFVLLEGVLGWKWRQFGGNFVPSNTPSQGRQSPEDGWHVVAPVEIDQLCETCCERPFICEWQEERVSVGQTQTYSHDFQSSTENLHTVGSFSPPHRLLPAFFNWGIESFLVIENRKGSFLNLWPSGGRPWFTISGHTLLKLNQEAEMLWRLSSKFPQWVENLWLIGSWDISVSCSRVSYASIFGHFIIFIRRALTTWQAVEMSGPPSNGKVPPAKPKPSASAGSGASAGPAKKKVCLSSPTLTILHFETLDTPQKSHWGSEWLFFAPFSY